MSEKGIGGHQRAYRGEKEEWLTPPEIIGDLGPFDLDPCAAVNQPWRTAAKHYTIEDNGLMLPWEGFVWCNPPYGPDTKSWLERMVIHGNGIALMFARTETKMFFDFVWAVAGATMHFIEGRLYFHHSDGSRAKNNSGGPSVLVGYGELARERLTRSTIPGALIYA